VGWIEIRKEKLVGWLIGWLVSIIEARQIGAIVVIGETSCCGNDSVID